MLFRAPDAAPLLTLPSRVERVFLYKLQEAILLSSWAFMLLGSPMLVAYGVVGRAPWYYMAMLFPYLAAFTYIPAGIGAILCLLLVRFLPRGWRLLWLLLLAAVVALLLSAGWWLMAAGRNDLLTPRWFQTMLGRLSATEMPLLPSWWLSDGLLSAARENWPHAVMFLVLLIANALPGGAAVVRDPGRPRLPPRPDSRQQGQPSVPPPAACGLDRPRGERGCWRRFRPPCGS